MPDVPLERIDGLNALGGIFVEIEEQIKAADYTPALEPHLQGLEELHSGFFQGSVDPNGSPWRPLAPSTVARKGHDTILVETTQLVQSLVSETSESVRAVSERGLIFGTSDEKAMFHQEGTARMPARPMVGLQEEYLDKIVDDVAGRTVEEMKAKV